MLQNLFVKIEDTHEILADSRVMGATLTGSVGAGRAVAWTAAKHLKKSVLELGGSDPFVVLRDADLNEAATQGVYSRMLNNGETCIAAKRFIVEKAVAEEFTEKVHQKIANLRVGDPLDPKVEIGPMARSDLRDALHDQVVRSVEKGCTLVIGGHPIPGDGLFYSPTLLTDVVPGCPAFEEELFGPVASLVVAEDAEDALRLANLSPFGLGGSIFTKDIKKGEEMAKRMQVGVSFVNGFVKSDPRLPFGGIKASGYGRECSALSVREFCNAQTIWVK